MQDGGLLWPAGPAPTENGDAAGMRRGAASLPCARPPLRRRRDAGPIIARIDVTSEHDIILDMIDQDNDTTRSCIATGAEPHRQTSPGVCHNTREVTSPTASASMRDDMDRIESDHDSVYSATSSSVFGPRLGLGSKYDALHDDNADISLVRRRRDRRAQTGRTVTRAPRDSSKQQPVETQPMHEEPTPSAPSAALFDWHAFRLCLADASLSAIPSHVDDPAAHMASRDAIDSQALAVPAPTVDMSAHLADITLRSEPLRQPTYAPPLAATPPAPRETPSTARSIDASTSSFQHPLGTSASFAKQQQHKPWAAPGDLVLVEREPHGHRAVGTVLDFDGAWYHIGVPRRADSGPATVLSLSLTGLCTTSAEHTSARWANGQLDECAVCMDAEAGAWFDCRCTVPAMCVDCAHVIDTCPYCDVRLERPPARIERDLAVVPGESPWISVPLRIVLDGVTAGRRPQEVRAQLAWPGVLLKAAIGHAIGHDMKESRLLVGGRHLADQAPLGTQGVSNGRLVCVIPRLRGD
nr:RING-finger motif-containing protein [Pandoravirus massiliensis]